MLRILTPHDPDYEARLSALAGRGTACQGHRDPRCGIVAKVRREGDRALREFTERFEHRQLAAIELPRPDWLEQAGRPAWRSGERWPTRPRAFAPIIS